MICPILRKIWDYKWELHKKYNLFRDTSHKVIIRLSESLNYRDARTIIYHSVDIFHLDVAHYSYLHKGLFWVFNGKLECTIFFFIAWVSVIKIKHRLFLFLYFIIILIGIMFYVLSIFWCMITKYSVASIKVSIAIIYKY